MFEGVGATSRTTGADDAVRRVTAQLCTDGDHDALLASAARALRGEVGYDVAVWATVDPVTVMWTSCLLDGMPRDPELEAAVFDNEYAGVDVLKLVDLAGSGRSATVWRATDGRPTDSPRHRDLLAPAGFGDELRVVLSDGSTPWGALLLLRGGLPFTEDEMRVVDALTRPLALALRAALTRTATEGRPTGGAGMVVCAADGSVSALTDEAAALLGFRGGTGSSMPELPQVLASVLASRRAGRGHTAVAPTADGRWLSFTATALGNDPAVVVEPLPAHRSADLLVRSRGLTPRERDVLLLVARGRTNRQVANALHISDFTVGDHVKSLFVKLGVGSRSELTATLFREAFAPLHESREL